MNYLDFLGKLILFVVFTWFAFCIPAIADSTPDKKKVQLPSAEKAWLKGHPVIRLGFIHFEPVLMQDENGALSGYLVDLFKEINTLLGSSITIEVDDLAQTEQKVRNREVDGWLVSSLPRAKENNLLTTTPFHEVYPIVFARSDASFVVSNLDDLAGKKIAYQ